jgi:3-dehydroquinate synthase
VLPTQTQVVPVDLGPRSYSATIGRGVLGPALRGTLIACATPRADPTDRVTPLGPVRRCLIVLDTGVPATLLDAAIDALHTQGISPHAHPLTPTEHDKSLASLASVLESAARAGLERNDLILALGGGIVGDLAGFAAASYRRGIRFIQCPTTLLSMVDASVGGKTGVNLLVPDASGHAALLKNMVGAFWQPAAVIADTAALDALPDRHLRAGLAECVKHALIARSIPGPTPSSDPLVGLRSTIARVLARDPAAAAELVAHNVALKARVVAGDERELAPSKAGGRALLNLGHTFAHAIETLPGLSPDPSRPDLAPLHHGEAVGLGLVAAAAAAACLGMLPAALAAEVTELVAACGLPTRVRGLAPTAEVAARMAHDKKASGGVLRLVLPDASDGSGLGRARVVEGPPPHAVAAGIDAIRL